ncbi:ketoacyl-ACP synthase III [Saccharicrinis fermentans]|uniref:3-oxoacyl-[acyl-carrier-protein] synthase 3 n=1 Tax=Saccharicrinis fermentans DSM 9555 = JCM 21142 TaxID=869213 RepID=W7Y6K4_9BACT|nr:ketoacyl-ACP synthase III [Saccharicrinis fermentans]GAF03268.1 3-oxoacyl-[acyl-carrier-protein] synthase 3 [Saccharicrinis fermentans DSM 9555 = JCM 21142]
MALFSFDNIGIKGIAGAVPKHVIDNYNYDEFFSKDEIKEVVDKIGVKERRFADKDTCASDLCFAAAEKLLEGMNINREEIDLLIFISQTPDYRMPATSIILQERLKLPKSTIAFDVTLGCSAFLYGLSIAFSMISSGAVKRALILDGETRSKVYSKRDRKTSFLFGDAGVAALVEGGGEFGKSWFSLNSDGERESLIKIPAGGYRQMSSEETVKEKVIDEYGNMRSDEQAYMNGADVFNFVLREIPRDFKRLNEYAQNDLDKVDYFVFHQANSYINGFIARKLKLPADKIPSTIEKYGNTSSVSIPITIVSELKDKLKSHTRLMLSGFGVGLSWGTAILDVEDCYVADIVEV